MICLQLHLSSFSKSLVKQELVCQYSVWKGWCKYRQLFCKNLSYYNLFWIFVFFCLKILSKFQTDCQWNYSSVAFYVENIIKYNLHFFKCFLNFSFFHIAASIKKEILYLVNKVKFNFFHKSISFWAAVVIRIDFDFCSEHIMK